MNSYCECLHRLFSNVYNFKESWGASCNWFRANLDSNTFESFNGKNQIVLIVQGQGLSICRLRILCKKTQNSNHNINLKYIASKPLILLMSDFKQQKNPSLQINTPFLPTQLLSSLRKNACLIFSYCRLPGSTFETVCASAITFQICWTSARSNTR